jgi:hypothetical protein
MGEEAELLDIHVTKLTDDQQAALDLFRQPIIGWSKVPIFMRLPHEDGVRELGPHVRRYRCPIILWRGKRRLILPGGDTCECGAVND